MKPNLPIDNDNLWYISEADLNDMDDRRMGHLLNDMEWTDLFDSIPTIDSSAPRYSKTKLNALVAIHGPQIFVQNGKRYLILPLRTRVTLNDEGYQIKPAGCFGVSRSLMPQFSSMKDKYVDKLTRQFGWDFKVVLKPLKEIVMYQSHIDWKKVEHIKANLHDRMVVLGANQKLPIIDNENKIVDGMHRFIAQYNKYSVDSYLPFWQITNKRVEDVIEELKNSKHSL